MYLVKIAKHSTQQFKVGQTFCSPIFKGMCRVIHVADEQITAVQDQA